MSFSIRTFDYSSKRIIPCVVMEGPPNAKTYGGIGVLYMDKNTGSLYKCVSENFHDNLFAWEIVGEVSDDVIQHSVSDFFARNPGSTGLSDMEKRMLLTLFRGAAYQDESADETAEAFSILQNLWGDTANPDTKPDVTVTSISAVYSGGDVAVGTAVADLTGIVVTAHYSDGTSEPVAEYTLSGNIAEGENTVTVSYGGKTATFTVTGVTESGGGEAVSTNLFDGRYVVGALWSADSVSTTVTTCKTSDFLDCSDMSEIYLLRLESNVIKTCARTYFFYDENKTPISGYGGASLQTPSDVAPVEVPANAAYIRVCHGGSYAPKPTYIGANSNPDVSEFVDWTTEMEVV